MKPAAFEYHRPRSVGEALDLLSARGEDAKVLAGGQSLVPLMNLRLARPSTLIDINEVPGLAYVLEDGPGVRLGALVRHRQMARYPAALGGLDVLSAAARRIGHAPIRARGTVGGSIAHADGAAEWCLVAVALGANVVVAGPGGEREIAAADLFLGPFTTCLEPDELIVEVAFPQCWEHAAIEEFARVAGDFAVVATTVAFDVSGGRCQRPRVALAGVDSHPLRIPEAEAVLEGQSPCTELFDEAGRTAASAVDPPEDAHATADHRRQLAAGLVTRALGQAWGGTDPQAPATSPAGDGRALWPAGTDWGKGASA